MKQNLLAILLAFVSIPSFAGDSKKSRPGDTVDNGRSVDDGKKDEECTPDPNDPSKCKKKKDDKK
jgi:hypothetical protein